MKMIEVNFDWSSDDHDLDVRAKVEIDGDRAVMKQLNVLGLGATDLDEVFLDLEARAIELAREQI